MLPFKPLIISYAFHDDYKWFIKNKYFILLNLIKFKMFSSDC